jgi:hypothetical protein
MSMGVRLAPDHWSPIEDHLAELGAVREPGPPSRLALEAVLHPMRHGLPVALPQPPSVQVLAYLPVEPTVIGESDSGVDGTAR